MKDAPGWYREALDDEPERVSIQAEGVLTALRIWGPADGFPVVLVHGGAAHAAWWDHIGPRLVGCRVIALDLSGHGDSGWREQYRLDAWSDEVVSVVRSKFCTERPLLVGHSMGGLVAYATARKLGDALGGLMVVDSYFPSANEEDSWRIVRDPRRNVYPDQNSILDRFRLMPRSEPRAPFVIEHVARESMAAVDGGWSWKFDPRIFAHDGICIEDIDPIGGCPTVLVRGDKGLLDDNAACVLAKQLGAVDLVTVADSGHHVPLDQPLVLAEFIGEHVRRQAWPRVSLECTTTTIGGS